MICHPRPELTTRIFFPELGNLDVSQAALQATHLIAKARRLDRQKGHTPSPFLMEPHAPEKSGTAQSEKAGTPEVTISEDFHDLFSDQDVRITGWKRA